MNIRQVFSQGSFKIPSSLEQETFQWDVQETIEEIKTLVSHLYKLGAVTSREYHVIEESFNRLDRDYKGDK